MGYTRTVEYTTRDFRYEVEVESGEMELVRDEEDGEVMGITVFWWDSNDQEIAPSSDLYEQLETMFKAIPGHDRID